MWGVVLCGAVKCFIMRGVVCDEGRGAVWCGIW